MITRKLNKETDFNQFAEVSASAYIHPASETTFCDENDIFGTFIDDGKTLISQIESTYRNRWYGNIILPCAMVGGVASKPEYRRMGGVRETFNLVFQDAIEKGALISILFPFSTSYYRKFGYDVIANYYEADCAFSVFKSIERYPDLTLLKESNKDEFFEAYTEICLKYNLMLERKDFYGFSLTPYENSQFTYFINDAASKGYVTFTLNRPQRVVDVAEISYTDKNALLKLLGFLRVYDGNFDTVHFKKLPTDSVIPYVLDYDNRVFKRAMFTDGAGRVLNVKKFLEAIPYPAEDGKFTIKIIDKQIEMNNAVFTVTYKNQKGVVEVANGDDYCLALDIAQFSRIVLGREGLSPEAVAYLPDVETNGNPADLLKAFPRATVQFFDDF